MTTARQQADHVVGAALEPAYRAGETLSWGHVETAVELTGDIWEPLLREMWNVLAFFDTSSAIDPAVRRSMEQRRVNALFRTAEALGE